MNKTHIIINNKKLRENLDLIKEHIKEYNQILTATDTMVMSILFEYFMQNHPSFKEEKNERI